MAAVDLLPAEEKIVRIHQFLRETPAEGAGLMDRIWARSDFMEESE